jgi:hypothetical protein
MSIFTSQWKKIPSLIRFVLYFYGACFLQGGVRHWLDIANGGIFPYTNFNGGPDIPFIFNLYLASLAIIDLIVFMLIFLRPIYGLALAVIVMASDLLVNFHVLYTYSDIRLSENWMLQCLLLFGAFVFFSAPIIIIRLKKLRVGI